MLKRSAMNAMLGLAIASGVDAQSTMHIAVNIPAFRLDVYVADSVVRSMPVAVGMSRFRTPRGEFEISSIEWNPWWFPPERPWAARDHVTPPGPNNPMGRVKLNFRPLYFLHGTPFERSIGSAASHGCIRLRNDDAIALARLVQRAGAPSMSDDELGALAEDTVHSRAVRLAIPVRIELRYDRAELRAGVVSVYRDVYRIAAGSLRDELMAALATRSVDTSRLDTMAVRRLVERVPAAGRSIPLDQLMRPTAVRWSTAAGYLNTRLSVPAGSTRTCR